MDLSYIKEFYHLFVTAAGLTAKIASIGIIASLVLGLLIGLVRYLKIPILKEITGIYIELSRNTPLVIQLFFLYFGLPKLGIVISSEGCAIIGLTFLGGSYMAEAFRAGLEGVPKGQLEAANALGMTSYQTVLNIIIPQALSRGIPAIGANIIFLIKETSVFSIVALADLMYVAKDLIGVYYQTDETLLMLVIAYLILLLPVSLILRYIEGRLRYAEFGTAGAI